MQAVRELRAHQEPKVQQGSMNDWLLSAAVCYVGCLEHQSGTQQHITSLGGHRERCSCLALKECILEGISAATRKIHRFIHEASEEAGRRYLARGSQAEPPEPSTGSNTPSSTRRQMKDQRRRVEETELRQWLRRPMRDLRQE